MDSRVCLAGLLSSLVSVTAVSAQPTWTNVVLVLFDDLGFGDVEPFGGRIPTPSMNRLARDGVTATAFYVAQPVCSASRAAVLTGRYPHRVGVTGALFPGARNGLPCEETTLAELLKSHGYATAVFGKWHLGDRPTFHPFRHGFDEYFGVPYSHDMTTRDPAKRFTVPLTLIDGERIAVVEPDPATLTAAVTERACDFIRRKSGEPFFLYVPHPMPHVPIAASPEFVGRTGLGVYADVVHELDASVGALLATLASTGVLDRTLVIVTSDNGPWTPFGDHAGTTAGLREAKGTAFEGGIRVPFFARWPRHLPAGHEVSEPVIALDILPTVASLLGVPLPRQPLDGRDVSLALTGKGSAPRRPLVFRYEGSQIHAIREGRWKLHLPHQYPSLLGGEVGNGGVRGRTVPLRIANALFDLEQDPAESEDVAAQNPEIVARLSELAAADRARDTEVRRPERRWLGPEWCANRLQDWTRLGDVFRVRSSGSAFRTAVRLDQRLDPPSEGLAGEVVWELDLAIDNEQTLTSDCAAGLLLGAGNSTFDARLSALVHQAPGADGGLLVLVDGSQRLRVLDFSSAEDEGFRWSLPTGTTLDSLPQLAASTNPGNLVWRPATALTLRVSVSAMSANDPALGFRLKAELSSGQETLASAEVMGLKRSAIDGSYGLVGHRGPVPGWTLRHPRCRATRDGWIHSDPSTPFGPVLGILYTVATDPAPTLRLAAHLPPGASTEIGEVELELSDAHGTWRAVATVVPDSRGNVALFTVSGVSQLNAQRYRVRGSWRDPDGLERPFSADGRVRWPGTSGGDAVLGLASCVKHATGGAGWNPSTVWFPHGELVRHLIDQDPDLMLFVGDQMYEGDLTAPDRQQGSLDYLMRWHRFLWAFSPLTRDRPTVVTPDDHDVYHGNLWGAGGVRATAKDGLTAQDSGGYVMDAEFVNLVHATQTGHLPPPIVSGPIGQGIHPFTTRLISGPFDLAILSDRMWKDAPSVAVPEGAVRNGFFTARGFDPAASDRSGARLLGSEQETFLADWAEDGRAQAPLRALVSQSPFVAVQTLPEGCDDRVVPHLPVMSEEEWPESDVPSADCDTNGWPRSARDRAVRSLDRSGAIHLAGDQHLATVVQYGLEGFRDGPFVFTGPALANTWPRRWMPKAMGGGQGSDVARGLGDYVDAFGNRMTVLAVVNPHRTGREPARLHDLVPGYGIVRCAKDGSRILVEAWPRWADPAAGDSCYPGFPFRVR